MGGWFFGAGVDQVPADEDPEHAIPFMQWGPQREEPAAPPSFSVGVLFGQGLGGLGVEDGETDEGDDSGTVGGLVFGPTAVIGGSWAAPPSGGSA